MKNKNVFVFGSLLILSGCFGGSSGGNGLSVALTPENAATAAQLSMAAPKAVSGLLEGMIEDVPDEVFTDIEARTANRAAGIAAAMAATREEEACSHGGKVIVEESDTTFTITLENCTETESVPSTGDCKPNCVTALIGYPNAGNDERVRHNGTGTTPSSSQRLGNKH
ncbi:hypothetical protein, partial [Thiothrix unzii]|uniref:hypothetical protein n=1 Tax=Thiothrix unzii TaxID=111769 RepID=UPI002A36EDA4